MRMAITISLTNQESNALFQFECITFLEEEISVNVTVNPASTNQNGIPSYLGEEAYDASLIHRMDQLVAIEESELLIPAGSSVLTTLIISLPQEEWEGISLRHSFY